MNVTFINGDKYLTADEILESRKGECRAVMLSTVDENGKVDTYVSSGFSHAGAVHAVRKLARDVESIVYDGEFLGE